MEEAINAVIVIILVSIYFIISLKYIRYMNSHYGGVALFERSEFILLLANTSNFIETIFNVLTGLLYYSRVNSDIQYLLMALAIYGTRLFAICIAMRTYRIIMLNLFRSGNLTKETLVYRSSLKFLLIITNLYALLLTVPYMLFTVLYENDSQEAFNIYIWFTYGTESLGFFAMCYKIFEAGAHPTLVIEYLFYTVIWSTGLIIHNSQREIRWLYTIPIKNLALLLISINSIHEHSKLTRPPLPPDIEIAHIFEIECLYYDFINYVNERGNEEIKEACEMYKELLKANYNHKYSVLNALTANSRLVVDTIESLENESIHEAIKETLEHKLEEIVNAYVYSTHYRNFKKEYFINFNWKAIIFNKTIIYSLLYIANNLFVKKCGIKSILLILTLEKEKIIAILYTNFYYQVSYNMLI